MSTIDPNDPNLVLSPLADPVVNAMYANAEYCWAYTLYTAHTENKTVQEVIAVTPALQEYAEKDAGYQQFCERYQFVSSDPKTRKEYMLWFNDRMREEGEKEWLIQTAQKDGAIVIARNFLIIGRPVEEIAKATGLTIDEVSKIKEKL